MGGRRRGQGWPTDGIVGQEFHNEVTGADGTIAFFKLDGGLLLGLYERANLAKDAGLTLGPPSSTELQPGPPRRIPGRSRPGCSSRYRPREAPLTAPAHMRSLAGASPPAVKA